MYRILLIILVLFVTNFSARNVWSLPSVPQMIHYQANLTDPSGLNFDGNVSVEVWLYDSGELGVDGDLNDSHLIYAESHSDIHVARGVLKLSIGEGTGLGKFVGSPLPLESIASAQDLYIQLYLDDEKIEPRQYIGYRNAALKSQYAVSADSLIGNLTLSEDDLPENIPASKVTSDAVSLSRVGALPIATHLSTSSAVSPSLLPSDIPLMKINSGKLDSKCVEGISAEKITTGIFPDYLDLEGVVKRYDLGLSGAEPPHFTSGFASDGSWLPIPHGFSPSQCRWIVNLRDANNGSIDIDYIEVYTGNSVSYDDGGTKINCKLKNGSSVVPCSVDYLVVCQR